MQKKADQLKCGKKKDFQKINSHVWTTLTKYINILFFLNYVILSLLQEISLAISSRFIISKTNILPIHIHNPSTNLTVPKKKYLYANRYFIMRNIFKKNLQASRCFIMGTTFKSYLKANRYFMIGNILKKYLEANWYFIIGTILKKHLEANKYFIVGTILKKYSEANWYFIIGTILKKDHCIY